MSDEVKKVYIIVGNGVSDIGKGWLTASIGRLNPENTLPIKIDPFLNLTFPWNLGVDANEICNENDKKKLFDGTLQNKHKLSDDFRTYYEAGMSIFPECNILSGEVMREFLGTNDVYIRPGEIKKRTFNDLSFFLAKRITSIVKSRKRSILLIEIGGTISDLEHIYLPAAMRFLSSKDLLGITPEIILLTFFDIVETHIVGAYRVKTQRIRKGISRVRRIYCDLPLKACFVRRRNVPSDISDDVLKQDLVNVAYETQISPNKIVLLPNVKKEMIAHLTEIIRDTNLFS